MICKQFIHIGLGDTGEGMVRHAVQNFMRDEKGLGKMIDTRAHLSLFTSQEVLLKEGFKPEEMPLAFTMIRNPRDWYISWWIHELRNHRYQGSFYDFVLNWHQGYMNPARFRETVGREMTWPGLRMLDFWDYMTTPAPGCPNIAFIGQFEHFRRDFTQIFAHKLGLYPVEQIDEWFPAIYGQWHGRAWIENIEQWMADELYDRMLRRHVEVQDAPIFKRWGYKWNDRYEFLPT